MVFLLLAMVISFNALAAKPNIVLILMDNFGYGKIGVYGGRELRGTLTPNIGSIVADGFRLTNFIVEAKFTTSRAALLTSRYN